MAQDTLLVNDSSKDSGAAFTLAVENALKSIATLHSGTSFPTETYPNMLFRHTGTTPYSLWQRSSDNLSWNRLDTTTTNFLINGCFRLWQRGTSFTATGYGPDRWRIHALGTGGAATISRQEFTLGQTDVPGNPRCFCRWNQTTLATTNPELQQRIEFVETSSGENVTLGVWLKADAARTVQVGIRQHFGTGGTPSSDVDSSLQNINVTTSWAFYELHFAVPSVAGKTLGSNNNDYLTLRLVFPTGSTFTIDIAQIQVESGSIATNFERRNIQQEKNLCDRFYQTSYQNSTPAGTVTSLGQIGRFTDAACNWTTMYSLLPVVMRATPTANVYSPGSGSANYISCDGIDKAGAITAFGPNSIRIYVNNVLVNQSVGTYAHYTLDAEL